MSALGATAEGEAMTNAATEIVTEVHAGKGLDRDRVHVNPDLSKLQAHKVSNRVKVVQEDSATAINGARVATGVTVDAI